jgi:DNA modification methylase
VAATGPTQNKGNNGKVGQPYRAVCGKCGARRVDAQLGLEPDPDAYVAALVAVFREVKRVLRNDGTAWLNLSDSYANDAKWGGSTAGKHAKGLHGCDFIGRNRTQTGLAGKNLVGIPWRVAFALQDAGWILRSDCIWSKPNPMPESVRDRPTRSHEYIFLLSKGPQYFYDADAIREPHRDRNVVDGVYQNRKAINRVEWEPREKDGLARESFRMTDREYNPAGRNRRSVWEIATEPYPEAHFATFPTKLVEPCLLSGTSARGCCPACGAPYTRAVERTAAPASSHKGSYFDRGKTGVNGNGRVQSGERFEKATTGWRAGCACADAGDPIPCTILDPFCGSGTVSLVARKHGRHSWGIDLSAAYLELARERLGQLALPGLAAGG